jgi:hypothetical protein
MAVIVYGLYAVVVFWFAWTWFGGLRQQFFLEADAADPAIIGRLFQ